MMACLVITGAQRMTLIAAIEILLGLLALHLQLEAEAKQEFTGMDCNDQWKPRSEGFGHARMTRNMERESILRTETDKMIPRCAYDRSFTVRFPDRCEWKDGHRTDRKGGLNWYTCGSKTNKGPGAGVCSHATRQKLSFSLGQYTTIFQAEVCHQGMRGRESG
jgi:hypothetical protein